MFSSKEGFTLYVFRKEEFFESYGLSENPVMLFFYKTRWWKENWVPSKKYN